MLSMIRFVRCSALCLLLAVYSSNGSGAQPTLQSPSEFLGYELGTQFTLHHQVIEYFEYVAGASPQVELTTYGTTYEGRPLITAYIANEEHMERLETIRANNLRLTGLAAGEADLDAPVIVWLGYNVHGNESVGTEAAMKTLHALADPDNREAQGWLANTVVVMDPCLNPDGRDRYVTWYKQTAGGTPNPRLEAREHREPWPGGRTNHYYFDLNRDWAWMTQQEVRARVAHYNRWMPQIHVDFHEQGINNPYYFAPAAEPYHDAITDWQRDFQVEIGKNHAAYFDAEGWLYFTRQVFDLFYPGYGDTWPTFNGSIGMTYEQAGSGRAGLAVYTEEGDTLSLADRIARHHTTGLSTVEVAAANRARILDEFKRFFDRSNASPGNSYAGYVVKGLRDSDVRGIFEQHLERQGIRYAYATAEQPARGYRYADGADVSFEVQPGDMILSAFQPKSVLLQVLFDPQPVLSDSITYDVTSWALPYAYGLDAYASETRLSVPTTDRLPAPPPAPPDASAPYAYLAGWTSFEDARFAAALIQEGVRLRYAEKTFVVNEKTYPPGTIVITRAGNERLGDRFDELVRRMSTRFAQPVDGVSTGFVERGSDFGSADVHYIETPRVAMLAGSPLSAYSTGSAWHYFDEQLRYPVTLMKAGAFDVDDLSEYNVLLLPEGSYASLLHAENLTDLKRWIRDGGRLIAIGSAAAFLAGKEGFRLTPMPEATLNDSLELPQRSYEDRTREQIQDGVPGAIFKVHLDTSHPLAFGYADTYFTLKRNADVYAFFTEENDWNVGVLDEESHLSGFVGAEAKKELQRGLVLGIQNMGGGDIVYMADNPLFRGFWYQGRLLMANAILLR